MAKDLLDSRGSESQQRSNYVITSLMCYTLGTFFSHYYDVITLVLRPLR
jgi:hypothetical protein